MMITGSGIYALIALIFALISSAGCAEEAFYTEMPPYLRVRQEMVSQRIAQDVYVRRIYPETANDEVNAQMRELVDRMAEADQNSPWLTECEKSAYLDVGPVITRTGTSWMSFLTLSEVSSDAYARSVAFDARVYDIETGERIVLSDVLGDNSEAWEKLSSEVRRQLKEAFPDKQPDEERLGALCARENLEKAAFTMGAARMTLTYRADEIYPHGTSLVHVHLYYPDIRPLMTETAKRQTDNSKFRMVALTFDDGGAFGSSRRVLDQLRLHGAQATFFIVGRTIARNHDIITREQNAAYSIQSHSYTHRYSDKMTKEELFEEKAQFEAALTAVTGMKPTMMRAPGGEEYFYANRKIGYPMIHWTAAGGDAGSRDVRKIHQRVVYRVSDGAIVLLHDSNPLCSKYTPEILEDLDEMGYLCVTLEELFADNGVVPQANRTYISAFETQ